MSRPRPDAIDPMVPELPTSEYRADGGAAAAADRTADGREVDAPLVPDMS